MKETPIFYSIDRYEDFKSFLLTQNYIIENLTNVRTRLKGDHSYRVINHWSKVGLIDENRSENKGWRKFNILEMIWIAIIGELRKFGFSIEKIKTVKKSIASSSADPSDISSSGLLQYYSAIILERNESAFLLVFEDGSCVFATYQDLAYSELSQKTKNHFRISLHEIITKIIPDSGIRISDRMVPLSKEEMGLIYETRHSGADTIKVHFKDDIIDRMEIQENFEHPQRLKDLLEKADFMKVEATKANGKIVNVKSTIFKKKA